MCRPSCCDNSGGQGAGIAAVALILGAALIVAKIGPIVAKIVHIALEVIRFAALTTGLVLALAAITWAAIMITRWQLRRTAPAARSDPGDRGTGHPGFGKPGQPPGRLPGLRWQRHSPQGHRRQPLPAGRMPGVPAHQRAG